MAGLKPVVESRVATNKRQNDPEPFKVFTTDQPAELTARDYVVDRLIERENIVLVIGYPGAAKSNLAMNLMGSVVTGRSWFGHATITGSSALLFAPERPKEMKRRVRAFEQYHEVDASALGIVSDDIDFAHGDDNARRVVATVLDHEQRTGRKAGLIAFDTVFDLLNGGDENHPRDMGSVFRHLQQIQRETQTPIIAICHPSMDRAHEPRGHKSSLAKADLTIVVTADAKTDIRRWQVKKSNGLERKPSGIFTLQAVHIDNDTAPVVVAGGAQAPAGSKAEIVSQIIADAGGQIVVSSLTKSAREASLFQDVDPDACRVAVDRILRAMVIDGRAEIIGSGKARQVRIS